MKKKPFDSMGKDYDYETAKKEGLGPDKTGHWPSRAPKSGKILKGRGHPTFSKTEVGEELAGYEIEYRDDGYYSRKKVK
jgi:hypothetical protein